MSHDIDNVALAVLDEDGAALSRDYAQRLMAGHPASVQTLIDGSFTTIAHTVHSYVDAINAAFDTGMKVRYLNNQQARSIWGASRRR